MRFSIIVPAYKEKEVNGVLKLLLKQSPPASWKLGKIVVVACGYKKFPFLKNKKIRILKEGRRRGKSYAMNLALRNINSSSKSDAIVVHNADVFPKRNMLRNLLRPFEDPDVGMTCVRPVSLNDPKKFVGFLNTLVWALHHFVSLENTKVGEVFAFRNVIKKIPKGLAADEAYIESLLKGENYRIIYVPHAVVFNKGPQNLSEFIEQRRRIFTGHVHIKNKYGYKVSTMDIAKVAKALSKYFKTRPPKNCRQISWLLFAIFLEAYARLLGTIDFYVFKKVPYAWKIIESSRNNVK